MICVSTEEPRRLYRVLLGCKESTNIDSADAIQSKRWSKLFSLTPTLSTVGDHVKKRVKMRVQSVWEGLRRRRQLIRETEGEKQRASQLQTHAKIERGRLAAESQDARVTRLERLRRSHQLIRETEEEEERAARLQSLVESERQRRNLESQERRMLRLETDCLSQQQIRDTEGDDERATRLEEAAFRARQRCLSESAEQYAVRLQGYTERRLGRRIQPSKTTGIALRSRWTSPIYLDKLDRCCIHCRAKHFNSEVKFVHPNTFRKCCDLGRVRLDMFQNFPEALKDLFLRKREDSEVQKRLQNFFYDIIRNFNSAFAMAQMGAQVEARGRGPYCYRIHGQIYHQLGPLHPSEREPRRYGQIYALDTEMAAQERLGYARNMGCDPHLMRTLSELLSNINVYAQSYKMMSEVEQAELALAAQENRSFASIRMVFDTATGRGVSRRPYDLPTANEVAVVYMGDEGDVPSTRSLAVHLRREPGHILNIRDTDKVCDPLSYPLLFPTGERGWDTNMRDTNGSRITQKKYYSHLFSIRDTFNPILYGGKLFQQFAVGAYVKIEQNKLNFQRINQLRLRLDSYRGLQDYLAGEDFSGPPGRRIVLTSLHLGSPRTMQRSFQDAMAIVARYGKQTYFLTMICNTQWKEIRESLYFGQRASDRPDVVARVFNAKLQELCSHPFKKHVLDVVDAYVYVIEFQRRGLPHCHMLIIMSEQWKVRTAEEVDRAICAEIPNREEEPQLNAAITSYMIHRHCGAMNPQSPCMKNGMCSKKFSKPRKDRTAIDDDGYPNYRRRDLAPTEVNGTCYSDEWVVPSNPYLLT